MASRTVASPIVVDAQNVASFIADPFPQAVILTAIVIGFSVEALALVLPALASIRCCVLMTSTTRSPDHEREQRRDRMAAASSHRRIRSRPEPEAGAPFVVGCALLSLFMALSCLGPYGSLLPLNISTSPAITLQLMRSNFRLCFSTHSCCSPSPCNEHEQSDHLQPVLLLVLHGALNSIYLAADLVSIYVAIELISIVSFLLMVDLSVDTLWVAFRYLMLGDLSDVALPAGCFGGLREDRIICHRCGGQRPRGRHSVDPGWFADQVRSLSAGVLAAKNPCRHLR